MSLKTAPPGPSTVDAHAGTRNHDDVTRISERTVHSTESLGLLGRIRRGWARDSHLGLVRRIQKGLQLAIQLMRGRTALTSCNRVGANARVSGRMRVENRGSIVIGDHLNINSAWVPTELITGRAGRIEIGHDVLINFGTVIAAARGVTIGSGSMIGPHCIVSDIDIPEAPDALGSDLAKPIVIGRDVWIAGRVTIRPGVTIGDGAVVVAGSIVESDVPPHVMAVGIPARLLPKFASGPQPGADRTSAPAPQNTVKPVVATVARIDAVTPSRLRGTLVSDFTLDELVEELAITDGNAPGVVAVLVAGQPLQSLTTAPPVNARDFVVAWTRPEAVVPAFARVLAGETVDERQLTAEVDAFCRVVERCATYYRYVLVPTWTQPGYLRGRGLFDGRPGGSLLALSAMNLRLMSTLGRLANVFVLNAARWQAVVGPSASNPRAWYLGHIGAPRPLIVEAARDIRAALGALSGPQRSLLVLDRQDALWDGVAACSTVSSESRAEAFADFQQMLQVLKNRGVLLALLGTSNEVSLLDATRSRPGSALREQDFAVCSGTDGDEVANLKGLAARLGLAADAMVYITTRASVRAAVRAALPAVYVPDWPDDKLLFPSALQGLRCFDASTAVGVEVAVQ
jgi:acetyltransferase-like isoleucine patch superfamily enzyme